MANYSVGVVTKLKIIENCKELFYEKGIDETTYVDICKSAEINRGLLSYYFKTKDKIAGIIFTEFIANLDELISKEFSEIEYDVNFIINSILLFRMLKNDRKFLRFYYSVGAKEVLVNEIRLMEERFIHGLVEANNLDIAEDELKTLVCMCVGVESQMIKDLYNEFLTEPIDKIIQRDIYFVYNLLGVEKATMQKYYNQAKELASGYELTVNSSFEIKLTKNEIQ